MLTFVDTHWTTDDHKSSLEHVVLRWAKNQGLFGKELWQFNHSCIYMPNVARFVQIRTDSFLFSKDMYCTHTKTQVCFGKGLTDFKGNEFCFYASLTLYSKDTHFNTTTTDTFWKHCAKRRIAGNQHFLLFPQCFLLNQKLVSPFVNIYDILSLSAAELEEP